MTEILPAVERVKDNIKEGLSYDTVTEFEYLHNCFSESLRIEPPAAVSFGQMTTQDIVIGTRFLITLKKGTFL
jgi:cytochrome P450